MFIPNRKKCYRIGELPEAGTSSKISYSTIQQTSLCAIGLGEITLDREEVKESSLDR
jgi:hypothetical protein